MSQSNEKISSNQFIALRYNNKLAASQKYQTPIRDALEFGHALAEYRRGSSVSDERADSRLSHTQAERASFSIELEEIAFGHVQAKDGNVAMSVSTAQRMEFSHLHSTIDMSQCQG